MLLFYILFILLFFPKGVVMKRNFLIKPALMISAGLFLTHNVMAETLHTVLQQTINTNPDVQISVKDRDASVEELRGAKAGFLPTLDLSASAGRENTDNPFTNTSIDGNGTQTFNPREGSLTADERLFDGFSTSHTVRGDVAKLNSSNFKVANTSSDIALAATGAYLDVLKAQEFVSIASRNLATHNRIYNLIEKRSQSGVDQSADLTQTQGRMALAQSNLVDEQSNLNDAQTNYIEIVGEPPKNLIFPFPPTQFLPQSENQAIQMAIEDHPYLKSANEEMTAAYEQHQGSFSKNYPRFDLQLNAIRGRDINGVIGQNNQEDALILADYNLFNGGADVAIQHKTADLYAESSEQKQKIYRQIINNVQLSWNAWQTAKNLLPLLKEHRDASLNTFNAYQQQFQLGKRTLLDSLNAENEYYEANLSYVQGQYQALYSEYRLLNSMGLLLQAEHVMLPAATQA
jgi:outer membrane protein, adhesin transport system